MSYLNFLNTYFEFFFITRFLVHIIIIYYTYIVV